MPDRSPKALWETTLGQLELQVTRPNFDTWLRGTVGLRFDGDTLIVGTATDFAIEWLRSRMISQINRAASGVAGKPVAVAFEVLGAQPATSLQSKSTSRATDAPFSLQPDANFTFESFAAVDNARLAFRAALRFAANQRGCNPLVLHGPPGLGKSHLLHAIAHKALNQRQTVVLLSAEEFVNRYATAVRSGQPHAFRDAFQYCDILLIDDLHFLAPRLGSQEQFFNIFNSLHAANKRIAVSCNRAPADIAGLSSHLCSRLLAGLCVELRLPPSSARVEILRVKSRSLKHSLPDDVLHAIAGQPYSSVREFEGALNRVDMFAEMTNSPITLASLPSALTPFSSPSRSPTAEQIVDIVCKHFHISLNDLSSQSRSRDITYARHITMYLLRSDAHQPLSEIGRLLGNRNHATIIAGCRRINSELPTLPSTQRDVADLRSQLAHQSRTG